MRSDASAAVFPRSLQSCKARARDARVNQSRPTESGEWRPCRCDGVSWNGSFLHRAGQPAGPAVGGQGRLRVKTGQCHGTLGVARISHPAEPIRLRRQLLLWPGARRRRRAGGMVAPDAYRHAAAKADNSFKTAWDLYHLSFEDNEAEVVTAIHTSFLNNLQYISPTSTRIPGRTIVTAKSGSCSSRRQGDRARSSMPRRAARGAGSRASPDYSNPPTKVTPRRV